MPEKIKDKLVSIIIPFYNLGEYLEEAIKSCLNQTYKNIEIIVVNDGSTDEKSLKVLSKLKIKYQNRVQFIDQKNQGVGKTRNNGIKISNGEYICCLDADDKYNSYFIEKTVNKIITNERIGIVTTYTKLFGQINTIWHNQRYENNLIFTENVIHVASLFRKKIWKEVGGYDEKLTGYQDWDFWIKIIGNNYIWELIPEPLFLYRKHGKSMIDVSNNKRTELLSKIIKSNKTIFSKNIIGILLKHDNKYTDLFSNFYNENKKLITLQEIYKQIEIKYNETNNELLKTKDELIEEKSKSLNYINKYNETNNELLKIHNSKLWKTYLIYKKIKERFYPPKIIFLSRQTSIGNINYHKLIKGNNFNNKVLGICHEDWNGIKTATINQCSKVLLIKNISSYTHAKIIYDNIIKGKYNKICINGLPDNIEYLVDYIGNADTSIKIYIVWHGSYTQQSENHDHIWRFNKLRPFFNKIYKFGFVKKDSEKIFAMMGLKSHFIPNLINLNEIKKLQFNNHNDSTINQDVHISIPALFLWHKNNVNQIIAATLIKNSKVSVLNFPNMDYLSKIFKNKITVHEYLNKIDFYKLLYESHIISYVSLTECYPMVLLESLAFGKPCIVGKTSSFVFDKNKYLKDHLVVENPEDIFEIKQKIQDVIKNYKKIVIEIKKFLPELINENSKIVEMFFKT